MEGKIDRSNGMCVCDLPPNPVSMSAIRGTDGSRFAIISACSRMSLKPVRPISGCPSRDAAVPAPVFRCLQFMFLLEATSLFKHTIYSESKPTSKAILAERPS